MSYSEFCEIMKQEKQNSKNDLVSAFKKIDVNNDRFISFSELKKALTMVGSISATYIPPPANFEYLKAELMLIKTNETLQRWLHTIVEVLVSSALAVHSVSRKSCLIIISVISC